MYLCLSGSLPFDDENSDKEIARQTIYEEPHYSDKTWKSISKEAKDCVMGLLEKNPDKRMSISKLLNNPWFDSIKSSNKSKHTKNPSISNKKVLQK